MLLLAFNIRASIILRLSTFFVARSVAFVSRFPNKIVLDRMATKARDGKADDVIVIKSSKITTKKKRVASESEDEEISQKKGKSIASKKEKKSSSLDASDCIPGALHTTGGTILTALKNPHAAFQVTKYSFLVIFLFYSVYQLFYSLTHRTSYETICPLLLLLSQL